MVLDIIVRNIRHMLAEIICDKFDKAYRDTDTYNKLYNEGREWDNDRTSSSVYIVAAIILLVITFIIFLFNSDLYGF